MRGEELALHEFCGLWRALGRVLEDNTRSLPDLPPDGYLLRRAQAPIEAELLFPSRAGRTFYGLPLGVSCRCAGGELLFDVHAPGVPVLAAFGAGDIALHALLHAPVQHNRLRAAAGLAPDITS